MTNDIHRHATLLKAAARAAKNITTILDPYDLLQRTVDIICDEFGFYYAGVFFLDDAKQYAVLKAGRGEAGREMIHAGHRLAVGGNSMIGACIANRQGRIALDVGAEAVFFENPHLPKTRSEMALPLVVGEDVIGALTVQSTEEAAFHDEDIAALQTMADQLAIAIQNSNLHRQAERRSRLLKAANRVGKEVTSILDLEKLLPQTVNIICESYGLYYAGVFLVDEAGEYAVLRAGYGKAGKAMVADGHKLKIGTDSMIGACIAMSEARIALDVGEERVHFKNPHLPHTRSEMALPLIYGGKVLGAVTIQSSEERAFSEDDITTLITMAEHLAVAINNARLIDELKEAHDEILRNKVFEALTTASTEAIHWIGNKTLPISLTVSRLQQEIAEGQVDVDSLREDLEMIAESAAQIIQVKEQLIGAVREQKPRPVLFADVVQTAAHQRDISSDMLKVKIDPAAAYVIADSTQLVRAVGNILQNAAEAGAKSIRITAHETEERGFLEIMVDDNGSGMDRDVMEKAWSPFFTTRGVDHHGLGLPAAMHVISQAQGRIAIVSEQGKGSTVAMYLPKGILADEPLKTGSVKNLLLIDDNDDWANHFSNMLKGSNVKLTQTTDLKKLPAADLILVDENITSLPLAEVLDAIVKAGLAAKTVVLTSAINPERVTQFMHNGMKDVNVKPYSAGEVSELLK
ncbi:MAG TPA: GAF domain-containing protein [Anaerolineales bacterium]|nr:GAF domain-containing protein [Anaerolineales bacterium]HMV95443.1 GAF domain-containing protein [Anaerolineales bacterium]HMX18424.1 GAF domain-containing protein [Anaerolineales bacterium]HMX73658.1 GAF domain-containing protein [Anaerolineales bacterium]HMZ41466.1 GAF domain-containing protein [Anaerolineales bacterium]